MPRPEQLQPNNRRRASNQRRWCDWLVWLYDPFQSVRESADSTSDLKTLDLERSRWCTSNGKSAQPESWRRAWKKGAFGRLTCGAISQHSMQRSFEARL